MIRCVVHQPVIGEDDPLRPSPGAGVVAVAFVVLPPLGGGQLLLIVAEVITADGLARRHIPHVVVSAVPAQGLGFLLGDEVAGQLAVGEQVIRNVLGDGVRPILLHGGRRRGGCGRCGRRGCGRRLFLFLALGNQGGMVILCRQGDGGGRGRCNQGQQPFRGAQHHKQCHEQGKQRGEEGLLLHEKSFLSGIRRSRIISPA